MVAQNHRNRQLLHRISASVREYDAIQSAASRTVGLQQLAIPRDLLDSFSHDPAVVTGSTRRHQGWRAVEDIHNRVVRQRKVFQNFLRQVHNQENCERRNILDDPMSSLLRSLKALQQHKTSIATEAQKVAQELKDVKVVHQDVKDGYNKTLSHTSVVYPELSHIVALEESYKDQYQQIWEFAMSTLTLILDGVTPVWRTYGKTIGEDIRDFLIIPLYRNEFTGEARRYPITAFPKRSLRHWIALFLFYMASLGIMSLQIRGAASSTMHYMLHWIPYESFRWIILPLFWVMILVQWVFCILEFFVVSLQVGTLAWWIGWSIRIVS
ncbi:hypothetical protein BDN72DRAFT_867071 [Pluteus cervinus]|uniref:Uncharacterized protein n=1 Tax=Pluteus cervinus TaxID=181527 RepID=A0ACD3BHS8_9AGAR|nr:hypothetical protein BDN72DRAFT_867071 [Pluteus cervinus]